MTMRFLARMARIASLAMAVAPAIAQPAARAPGSIEADGSVDVPAFRLPPSIYLSDRARAALPRTVADPEAMMTAAVKAGQVAALRQRAPQIMGPRLEALKQTYKVNTRPGDLGGVPAVWATPIAGVPKANARKVLLDLPGGGFVMGTAGGTGMIESIPLAGLAQAEIVSITYRQGPEARYPAATEDVVKAYRALLTTHRAEDIAIFGCSAGGLLTAQTIPALLKAGLPLPAAIGIFCASADGRWGGDSRAFHRVFQGLSPEESRPIYFEGANTDDPMLSPLLSPEMLKHFPPSLFITATRARELSSAVTSHRALLKAGATSELQVWDGLGHAFFYDASIPETREAFDVMVRFFDKYLGLRQ